VPIGIYVLFLAAFCVGTTEFVIAGLLPDISLDLGVSIPVAGYLISSYAAGVAIGAPAVTLATARIPRKLNLLFLMAVFVAGHVWCAAAQSYDSLIVGRMIVALSHGSFFGVASVKAAAIAPEGRKGTAIAFIFAGITVANILGVPGGTAIGNLFGWRATFWAVGGTAAVVLVAMIFALPKDTRSEKAEANFGAQLSALANQKVLLTYLVFSTLLVGFWAFFTFIAPYLLNISQISQGQIPLMLLIFGLGATLGTMAGGRLADQFPNGTLAAAFPIIAVTYLLIVLAGDNATFLAIALFVFGAVGFLPGSPMVNRVLAGASKAPDLASTLVASAANAGIAIGATVGAQALSNGISYEKLPVIGFVFAVAAAAIMLFSLRIERKAR
jgi:DHA1 family inner membrane transport protein